MPIPPLVSPVDHLPDAERARTHRHSVLRGFGESAQRRLAAAHVAVIGAGGLGSPAVLALSAAGVGTLTVIDDDVVDVANLQRQVLHRLADVGAPKVRSAVRVAADLSPMTQVRAIAQRLSSGNADELLAGVDLVLDGTDTFASRAEVAAACERLGIPLVWGVVQEFHAQVTVFWSAPPVGMEPVTLADLHPPEQAGQVPSCAEVGVLGALTLQVGSLMAIEAIKLITGVGEPLLGRVLLIDALRARQSEVPLRRSHHGASAPVSPAPPIAQLTAHEMLTAQRENGALLLDVREPWETASGTVTGSVLLPLGDVLADPARVERELLASDSPVVVICAHGVRAQSAAEVLRHRGIDASVLAGGLAAWS